MEQVKLFDSHSLITKIKLEPCNMILIFKKPKKKTFDLSQKIVP